MSIIQFMWETWFVDMVHSTTIPGADYVTFIS